MKITPYTIADNETALSLENQLVQVKSLLLKYLRPTFHARSEVYQKYRRLCVKENGNLIGIMAWAHKFISLHRKRIRAVYLYDLGVHPDYREKGLAKRLMCSVFDDIGHRGPPSALDFLVYF